MLPILPIRIHSLFTLLILAVVAYLWWHQRRLRQQLDRLGQAISQKTEHAPAPSAPKGAETAPGASMGPIQETGRGLGLASAGKDLESYIGERWLPIVGIVALILGTSFFLKYAFENDLIGVTGRLILGLLGGLALIGLGEYWKTRYQRYAWVLSGGGVALLYLSIFAAFAYYRLIGHLAAFGSMCAVTIFCATLAIRYRAQVLAAVGILGGFLTPFLLSTGVDNQIGLFSYVALLNAGILGMAAFRNWRPLNALGMLGTLATFASWYATYYAPSKLFPTEGFLALFFIEYLLATIVGNVLAASQSTKGDLGLLTINAGWFFGWSYVLLHSNYEPYLGTFTALLATLYVALAWLVLALKKQDRNLALFLGGVALIFLTLVFPIQFNAHWITIAWAAEAAVLTILGFALPSSQLRAAAFAVLAVALARLVMFDSALPDIRAHILIFNKRFAAYLAVIAAAALMSRLSARQHPHIPAQPGRRLKATLILAGLWNILLLTVLSLEITSYFDRKTAELREQERRLTPSERQTLYPPVPPRRPERPRFEREEIPWRASYRAIANQRNAALSVFWSLYAAGLLAVGMVRRNRRIRLGALALFGVTVGKVFLVDLANLPTLYRFISFLALGLLLLGGAYLYHRRQASLQKP